MIETAEEAGSTVAVEPKPKAAPRRWACAVHFLAGKHWTPTVAVTIEGGSYAAVAAKAIRQAKAKRADLLKGKRIHGVTVRAEAVRT